MITEVIVESLYKKMDRKKRKTTLNSFISKITLEIMPLIHHNNLFL